MKKGNTLKILLFLIIVIISTCKKNDVKNLAYVPGEILFLVNGYVSFQKTYNMIDSLNLKIKELYGFRYELATIEDSVEIIKSIFSTKDYLKNDGQTYRVTYEKNMVKINVDFFNFDTVDANDWFCTILSNKLTESLSDRYFKWGVLNVKAGREQFWVDEISQIDIIKSAGLNYNVFLNY